MTFSSTNPDSGFTPPRTAVVVPPVPSPTTAEDCASATGAALFVRAPWRTYSTVSEPV
jgi:hypothetical protein